MKGAAIIPWLRKNDRISWLSRASRVRTLVTPRRRKPSQIASSSRLPMPARRASGRTLIANTQPQRGEPNSQSRTSPMTKPSMRPAASATRKKRCWRRPLP